MELYIKTAKKMWLHENVGIPAYYTIERSNIYNEM